MTAIKNITIIGSGNIADFLGRLFYSRQFNVQQIISRNETTGKVLAGKVNASYSPLFQLQPDTHLVLLCVPDEQIEVCAGQLPETDAIVCHCAGSITIDALTKFRHHGVMYPLQSITKNVDIDATDIPFLLEANSGKSSELLEELMRVTRFKYRSVNSEDRLHYHLAAVFANNFTNAMLVATHEITKKNHLDFSLLEPLIRQTFEKLKGSTPFDAQTGPAKRNDHITINKHLELLKAEPNLLEIYKQVSIYIAERFKH